MLSQKSGCTGAIFSFEPSRTENLANRRRPSTSSQHTLRNPALRAMVLELKIALEQRENRFDDLLHRPWLSENCLRLLFGIDSLVS